MYLKVFRHTGYESIIEGEITQTGVGFLYRKQVMSLLDIFRKKRNEALPVTAPGSLTEEPESVSLSPDMKKEEVYEEK